MTATAQSATLPPAPAAWQADAVGAVRRAADVYSIRGELFQPAAAPPVLRVVYRADSLHVTAGDVRVTLRTDSRGRFVEGDRAGQDPTPAGATG